MSPFARCLPTTPRRSRGDETHFFFRGSEPGSQSLLTSTPTEFKGSFREFVRGILLLSLMVACSTCSLMAADAPVVLEIWPGQVPDESGSIGSERVIMSPK